MCELISAASYLGRRRVISTLWKELADAFAEKGESEMKTTNHAERLRKWAENVAEYGPDIRQWGSSLFVIEEMRKIADDFVTLNRRETELTAALDMHTQACAKERIGELKTELTSAREAFKEIGAYGNAAARLWLNDHPEQEPEGKKE